MACARYLEEMFEKWLCSDNVNFFKDLKELMLMEQFNNIAGDEIDTKIREKRFTSTKEAPTWANDRVPVLLASEYQQVSTIPYTDDKSASRSALGDTSSVQVKERRDGERITLTKNPNPPSSSKLTCFCSTLVAHIRQNCAKWKVTQIPKPVALDIGSSQGSEEGSECGSGNDMVSDRLDRCLGCTLLGKADMVLSL